MLNTSNSIITEKIKWGKGSRERKLMTLKEKKRVKKFD
jgi:hypothetical protein